MKLISNVDELAIARVNNATDNTKVSPTDILKVALHDIETGVIQCDTLLVIAISKRPECEDINYLRCNVTRIEEVAYFEMAKYKSLKAWRNEE